MTKIELTCVDDNATGYGNTSQQWPTTVPAGYSFGANGANPGDPLTVTVDGRSRGLLIVARGPVIDQLEKMIMDAIMGLWSATKVGEGTTFTVKLPRKMQVTDRKRAG